MVRATKQKQLLGEEIKQLKSFFDAYTLHRNVSRKDRKLGIATVYRFLTQLEEQGGIHSFICDKKRIYSSNKVNHAHFKCERCGQVTHLKITNIDFLKELKDNEVCHFQIEISGICSTCRKKVE